MNHLTAHLIENLIELTVGSVRAIITPNQFRLPYKEADPVWQSKQVDDFYRIPSTLPKFKLKAHPSIPIGGIRARYTFESPYPSPYPWNNVVHGLAVLHPASKARGALIFLHGHSMHNFSSLEAFSRRLILHGLDVYYLALPYHMRRAPRGTWSGQYSLSANIERTLMAFRQGVMDARVLLSWILENRGTPVAVAGTSLGGFTASMMAVVDERPFAVIPIISGASLAQIIWSGFPLRAIRQDLKYGGIFPQQLEQYWAMAAPGNWYPRVPKDRVMLLAGKYDPIVSPKNVEQLWRAWDQPELHWFPSGHASIVLYHQQVSQVMEAFLKQKLAERLEPAVVQEPQLVQR
jgi:pimeloyl-ACP methyl ester carboxylesterase